MLCQRLECVRTRWVDQMRLDHRAVRAVPGELDATVPLDEPGVELQVVRGELAIIAGERLERNPTPHVPRDGPSLHGIPELHQA